MEKQAVKKSSILELSDIEHLRKTVAANATEAEFKTLMYLSAAYNLDPLKKEIYLMLELSDKDGLVENFSMSLNLTV